MAKRLETSLLAWYRKHRRDLPWRRTGDPYAIWISEVMLQQTRVDTVIPYYEQFLDRWPTVKALAAADPDDVRAAWSGLGYYRRAKSMLAAANVLAKDHGGALPADLDRLKALPGFGRYTAGAVGSIAFGIRAPAVDGNVQRVIARLFGIAGDVTRGAPNRDVWEHATHLATATSNVGDLNQALIELGATVCGWRNPACDICPVRSECRANADHTQSTIPPPRVRAKRKRVDKTGLLIVHGDGSIVLEKQPTDGLFADLWCLPMVDGQLDVDAALDEAARVYGFSLTGGEVVAETKNVLTHRDFHVRIVRTADVPRRVRKPLVRVRLDALSDYGIPTITVRALRASLRSDELAIAELVDRRSAGTRRARQTPLESK